MQATILFSPFYFFNFNNQIIINIRLDHFAHAFTRHYSIHFMSTNTENIFKISLIREFQKTSRSKSRYKNTQSQQDGYINRRGTS